jgi:hypothetical protein
VREQTRSGSWHLPLQDQINEKSNASAFPYQSKKQQQERTPRLQIRYARNQLFKKEEVGGRSHHV